MKHAPTQHLHITLSHTHTHGPAVMCHGLLSLVAILDFEWPIDITYSLASCTIIAPYEMELSLYGMIATYLESRDSKDIFKWKQVLCLTFGTLGRLHRLDR